MRRTETYRIALCGVLAALALTIMAMGTLIPVATFVCPVLCMLILKLVLGICGRRLAVAWYGAVAILSLLLAPDKEAAAVFASLGYYPILKPRLDKTRLHLLWKVLYFNTVILLMYQLLIRLLGMDALAEEFREAGTVINLVTLLLGNVTFFLLDKLLGRKWKR